MRMLRLAIPAFLLCPLGAAGLRAGIIADYRAEFQGPTPATGWSYLWNYPSAVGNPASYASLVWAGSSYNSDGGALPRPGDAQYVNLAGTGGHPGAGTAQGASFDRYAIAAYTVQPGEGGIVQFAGSAISVPSGSSNGVDVRTYLNNQLLTSFIRTGGGAASSFDGFIGWVDPGDRLYVAVGPNTNHNYDSFSLAYRIEHVGASNVVWDADGALPVGGSGGWDTSAARWAAPDLASHSAWNNAGNLNAHFAGAAGTATLAEPVTARSLSFHAGGFAVDGASPLTLTSAGSGGPGAATLWVLNAADTATVSAPIGGSAGLAKTGSGTLVLGGNNSYTGTTTVGQGTLVAASGNALGSAADPTVVASGATLAIQGNVALPENLTLNGTGVGGTQGALRNISGVNALDGTVNLATGSTLNVAGGSLSLNGAVTGAGTLTKAGPGTLILAGPNTYSGDTIVAAGTLQLGAANAIPDGAGKGNVALTGTLDLGSHSETINGLSGTGVVDNTVGAGTCTLTVGGNNASSVFTGVIQNTSGAVALTKTGTGTLVLAGANTYSGATTINAGVLKLPGLPSANPVLWFDATDTDGDGVTDNLPNGMAIQTWVNKGSLSGVNATQPTAAKRPVVTNNSMNGNAVLSFNRTSTEDWLEANSASLSSVLNNSHTLYVVARTNTGGADSSTNAAQAVAVSPGWHNGIWLSGYPSATSVSSGQWLNSNSTSIYSSGAYTLGSPVVAGAVVVGSQTAGPTSIQLFLNGLERPAGANANATLSNSNSTILRIGAANTSGTYVWFLTGDVAEVRLYSSALSAGDRLAVELGLMAKWLGMPLAYNSIPSNSPVTIAGPGTLDLSGNSQAIGSLAGEGSVLLGAGTLTTGGDNSSTAFAGQIAGSGGLVKAGSGAFTLGGANTYTGPTTVQAGMLLVNGSITSDVTVAGGHLAGSGTIHGSVVVGPLGSFSAGASPGHMLIVGDYTQAGTMRIEIAGPLQGIDYDWLEVTGSPGTASLGGTIEVSFVGGFLPASPISFNVLTAEGGILGLEDVAFDFSRSEGSPLWSAAVVALPDGRSALQLDFAGVPEPASLALLALGALALRRRRRAHGASLQ